MYPLVYPLAKGTKGTPRCVPSSPSEVRRHLAIRILGTPAPVYIEARMQSYAVLLVALMAAFVGRGTFLLVPFMITCAGRGTFSCSLSAPCLEPRVLSCSAGNLRFLVRAKDGVLRMIAFASWSGPRTVFCSDGYTCFLVRAKDIIGAAFPDRGRGPHPVVLLAALQPQTFLYTASLLS